MSTFAEHIIIDAPIKAVWKVLADIGAIHKWNPAVVDSHCITSGVLGIESQRRCHLGGRNYLDEEVIEWVPETKLTLRIVATNLPFKSAHIRFMLWERDGEAHVKVSPVYDLKFGPLGKLMDVLFVRSRYRRGMVNLLRGLKRRVESGQASPTSRIG